LQRLRLRRRFLKGLECGDQGSRLQRSRLRHRFNRLEVQRLRLKYRFNRLRVWRLRLKYRLKRLSSYGD
jgi:hypothetical protein